MPAKQINLLGKTDFDKTPVGKFLRWSLTYGRYIIICTEIIVLLAFIYRFSLDRRITDLKEEIDQKIAIIEANQGFEEQFRNLQNRVEQIGKLIQNEGTTASTLHHLEELTPKGIVFSEFSLTENKITIQASADTSSALALFLKNLKASTKLNQIALTSISKKSSDTTDTLFKVEAEIVKK